MKIKNQFVVLAWLRWRLFLSENKQNLLVKLSSNILFVLAIVVFFSLGFSTGYILNYATIQNYDFQIIRIDWLQISETLFASMMFLSILAKVQFSKEVLYGILKNISIFPIKDKTILLFNILFSFFCFHNIIFLFTAIGFITGVGLITKSFLMYLLFLGIVLFSYLSFVIVIELFFQAIKWFMDLHKIKKIIFFVLFVLFILLILKTNSFEILEKNNPLYLILHILYSYLYFSNISTLQIFYLFLSSFFSFLVLITFFLYQNRHNDASYYSLIKLKKNKQTLHKTFLDRYMYMTGPFHFILEIKSILRAKSIQVSFIYISILIIVFGNQLDGLNLIVTLVALSVTFMLQIESNLFGFDKYALFVTVGNNNNIKQILLRKNTIILLFNALLVLIEIIVFYNSINNYLSIFITLVLFFNILSVLLGNYSSINFAFPFDRLSIKQKQQLNNNYFIIMVLILVLVLFIAFLKDYIVLLSFFVGIVSILLYFIYLFSLSYYLKKQPKILQQIYMGMKKNA